MSNYEKPVLTNKGLEILTRKNAGNDLGTPLKITKMSIGSGMLLPNKKAEELTELIEKIKDINIINFEITGLGLSNVTGEINNVGIERETPIFEIGVYAEDPDSKKDVLYTYVYTRNSPAILYQPLSTLYFGEFTVKTIISRDGETVANVIKPEKARNIGYDNNVSSLKAKNLQEAVDELSDLKLNDAKYMISAVLNHNLNAYPVVQVAKITSGAGYGGAGATLAGGENISVFARCIYVDHNNLVLYLQEELKNPVLSKIDDTTYVLTGSSEYSYQILLVINYEHPQNHRANMIIQDAQNRFVSDEEKAFWNAKAGTNTATPFKDGLMSSQENLKLSEIEERANNYTHPDKHLASMITQDDDNQFVSKAKIAEWNGLDSKKLDDVKHMIPIPLEHNLNTYPHVRVMKVADGAGCGGAGEVPAGGDNISVYFSYKYVDRNTILIYLQKELINPILNRIDETTYTITDNGEASYQLFLS